MTSVSALGHFMSAAAPTFAVLLLARLLIAVGIGSLYVISSILLAQRSQKKIAGYNLTFISFNMGVIAAPFAAAFAMQVFGWNWRELFAIAGIFQCIAIPASYWIRDEKELDLSSPLSSLVLQAFTKYKKIIRSKNTWIYLGWGMSFVSQYLAYISQVPFALKQLGCSIQTITSILALPSFASLLFGIFWGRIFAKKTEHQLIRWGIWFHGVFILLSASSCLFLDRIFLSSLICLIVLQSLIGSLLLPLSLSQVIQIFPEEETTLVSFASVVRSILSTIMVFLGAFFFTAHSLSVYLILTVASVCSFLFPMFLLKSNPKIFRQSTIP